MSDEIDLDGIESGMKSLPRGPWRRTDGMGDIFGLDDEFVARSTWPDVGRFIVSAPTNLLALVAEVRRMREENERLRQAEEEMRDDLNGILDGIYGGEDTEYGIEDEAGELADLAKSRLKLSEYGRVSAQQRAEIDRLRAKVAAGERLAKRASAVASYVPTETSCRYCGDSTFDHECVTHAIECGVEFHAALAAYREGKDGTK